MSAIIILGLFLWFTVAIWPAYLAKKKGYSFLLFLLVSWAISWLFALIIVLVLEDKNASKSEGVAD